MKSDLSVKSNRMWRRVPNERRWLSAAGNNKFAFDFRYLHDRMATLCSVADPQTHQEFVFTFVYIYSSNSAAAKELGVLNIRESYLAKLNDRLLQLGQFAARNQSK